jgi:hypothetical protein
MSNQTIHIKISTEKNQGNKIAVRAYQGDLGSGFRKAHKKAMQQNTSGVTLDSLMPR